MVRADSAGATPGSCRAAGPATSGSRSWPAKTARFTRQSPASTSTTTAGSRRSPKPARNESGAAVCEVTDLVDLSGWPQGTRLIVRREPLHPGAQTSLFPSLEFRYWGHYTDQPGDPVTLDVHMRAHAHVEDHIRRLKDSGLDRFPFADLDANRAWLAIVAFAADLVRWFQLVCLDGPLAIAEPKMLRWQLWHTPARVVRRARRQIVRILDDWPSTTTLINAYTRIALLT